MIKLLSAAIMSVVLLILGGCASNPRNITWLGCDQDKPVVSTFDHNGKYEIFSCELPKPGSVTTIGNKNPLYIWRMPSGKTCSYDKGPDKELFSKGITTLYGLRTPKNGITWMDCSYDIGFMHVKDVDVFGFKS